MIVQIHLIPIVTCSYKPLNKSQVQVSQFTCTVAENKVTNKKIVKYFIKLSKLVTIQGGSE